MARSRKKRHSSVRGVDTRLNRINVIWITICRVSRDIMPIMTSLRFARARKVVQWYTANRMRSTDKMMLSLGSKPTTMINGRPVEWVVMMGVVEPPGDGEWSVRLTSSTPQPLYTCCEALKRQRHTHTHTDTAVP